MRRRGRRQRGHRNAVPWIVIGVVGIILLAAFIAVITSAGRRGDRDMPGGLGGAGRQTPEDERVESALMFASDFNPPPHWTHQDLANHLRSKGTPVTVR